MGWVIARGYAGTPAAFLGSTGQGASGVARSRASSMDCFDTSECPLEAGLTQCRPEGFCAPPCSDGETFGTGASQQLCVAGAFAPCADQDPATACRACGCEPFGGGMCTSAGCELPRADGEDCVADAQCASHACYRDTSTCGPPRAMGEPCVADAECETGNCGADGGSMGVCNQPLGSSCTRGTTTCSLCVGATTLSDGICSRRRCDPTDRPNCPRTDRRSWECSRTVDGDYRCFERCNPDASYFCLADFDLCHPDGYCY